MTTDAGSGALLGRRLTDGWRLRVDALRGAGGPAAGADLDHLDGLVGAADAELDRYREACRSGAGAPRDALDRAVDDVRRAVERAEDATGAGQPR